MMVYICTKFHENIMNGIRVMERTRKVNGRTDGRPDRRTDGGHDIIPPVLRGRSTLGVMLKRVRACFFSGCTVDNSLAKLVRYLFVQANKPCSISHLVDYLNQVLYDILK